MRFYAIVETLAGKADPAGAAVGMVAQDGGLLSMCGPKGWAAGGATAFRLVTGDGDDMAVPITRAQAVQIQKRLGVDAPLPRALA